MYLTYHRPITCLHTLGYQGCQEEAFARCVPCAVIAVMVETYAILGFLATFFFLLGFGIWAG